MNQKLIDALAGVNENEVLQEVEELKKKNVSVFDIISDLQEGMNLVGQKFESGEYFLTELIMSVEIFKEASKMIGGMDKVEEVSKSGTFIIGTIYGDIHDIGKNIVSAIMKVSGFRVIDLGVDVPSDKFIDAIKEHKPQIVGMSCLLTTSLDHIRETIASIEKAGLRRDIKILIGGGPVDENACKYVKADAFCKNAQEAVKTSKKYLAN